MRIRYGTSAWTHQFPASRIPTFPRFRGETTADVVVVGGGLTGGATAYLCAAAGLKTILLERDRIGLGRSGRSAGLLMPEPGPSFRIVSAAHGLKAARRVFEAWRRGALEAAALQRRLGVRGHLDGREWLTIAGIDQERDLRREFDARQEAGLDVAWLKRTQVSDRMQIDAAAGLKTRDGGLLDPYRACIGLVGAAAALGAVCYERSRVKAVRFTRKHAEVLLEDGKIRTPKVVIATGSATAEFKQLQRHLARREGYVVLTEPMPAAMRKQLGDPRVVMSQPHVPHTRVARTRDHRLLITGGDQNETPERTRQAVLMQRTGQLMYDVLKTYPAISGLRPEYGWDVPYGEAADGLMYIGAHRNYPHHLFALGGGAASVTGAFVAARILLRAVTGEPDKADDVFGWTR